MSNIVSSDPVADMLTRIRNAMAVGKSEISLPHSKHKQAVAEVLKASKFINDVKVSGENTAKTLTVVINGELEAPRITDIKVVSKPGRRMYVGAAEIPMVRHGRGLVIISTSKGLMTGTEAKAAGLGGELICQVY